MDNSGLAKHLVHTPPEKPEFKYVPNTPVPTVGPTKENAKKLTEQGTLDKLKGIISDPYVQGALGAGTLAGILSTIPGRKRNKVEKLLTALVIGGGVSGLGVYGAQKGWFKGSDTANA